MVDPENRYGFPSPSDQNHCHPPTRCACHLVEHICTPMGSVYQIRCVGQSAGHGSAGKERGATRNTCPPSWAMVSLRRSLSSVSYISLLLLLPVSSSASFPVPLRARVKIGILGSLDEIPSTT